MTSIKIQEILNKINHVGFYGDKFAVVNRITKISKESNDPNSLSWCSDKNIDILKDIKAGTYIISKNIPENYKKTNCNYIIVENPRQAFRDILTLFFIEKMEAVISKSAKIHDSVSIGQNVTIGEHVVVEKNCTIGNNVVIQHNTVIFKDTIIEDNVIIGSNNTIGGVGFGYEKDEKGDFQFIPHIGNVVLKRNVEIGNNTTIDKAVLGSTILEENVKVDNLVHIAHGVSIGRNSMVIANSMIAGSVRIGENSWVSPSSSILNQKSVGQNSVIGMGAVVIKDVEDNEVVIGNPAKVLKK